MAHFTFFTEEIRRSGVALAMRHRLIHLQAHGLRKGNEHPAYTSRGVWHTLPFLPEEIHPGYATATTVLVTGAAWAYAFFRHTTVR